MQPPDFILASDSRTLQQYHSDETAARSQGDEIARETKPGTDHPMMTSSPL
jgi:hypothetical protein